jgi:hypothetical protein
MHNNPVSLAGNTGYVVACVKSLEQSALSTALSREATHGQISQEKGPAIGPNP